MPLPLLPLALPGIVKGASSLGKVLFPNKGKNFLGGIFSKKKKTPSIPTNNIIPSLAETQSLNRIQPLWDTNNEAPKTDYTPFIIIGSLILGIFLISNFSNKTTKRRY